MCLIRFGRQGREKPGVLLDEKRRDLSAYFQDWNSTFFAESGLIIRGFQLSCKRMKREAFQRYVKSTVGALPLLGPAKSCVWG